MIRTLWDIAHEALTRFDEDDGWAMSGYIAYAALLSIFPFLIFAMALAGRLIGPEDSAAVAHALFDLAPAHVAQTLEPVLSEVLDQRTGGFVTLSALVTIYLATNAVEAFRTAFDRAYDVSEPHGFLRRRLVALLFVVAAAVVFILLGSIIILAPLAVDLAVGWLIEEPPAILLRLRYLVGILFFSAFLFAVHLGLPSRRMPGRVLWPGVAVSTALWLVGAGMFSTYLSYAPSYSITYGALSGVIVTLLFFYLTGAMIIFGAEINAAWAARNGFSRWR